MVSLTIVSRFRGELPLNERDREIHGGPLYPPSEVLQLLAQPGEPLILWSKKCISDAFKLDFEVPDVVKLISQAVSKGRFIGAEWCVSKPGGPWAACDAYSIQRDEWIENARKELPCRYYVKFCIGKTGKMMLVASCHLEDIRRTK